MNMEIKEQIIEKGTPVKISVVVRVNSTHRRGMGVRTVREARAALTAEAGDALRKYLIEQKAEARRKDRAAIVAENEALQAQIEANTKLLDAADE